MRRHADCRHAKLLRLQPSTTYWLSDRISTSWSQPEIQFEIHLGPKRGSECPGSHGQVKEAPWSTHAKTPQEIQQAMEKPSTCMHDSELVHLHGSASTFAYAHTTKSILLTFDTQKRKSCEKIGCKHFWSDAD